MLELIQTFHHAPTEAGFAVVVLTGNLVALLSCAIVLLWRSLRPTKRRKR